MATQEGRLYIPASYVGINTAVNICEPWVELWAGDEWGESMHALIQASHTDYGLSDADCAAVAEILTRNVIDMHGWANSEEGRDYFDADDVTLTRVREEATEAREYWLFGGNLRQETEHPDAVAVIRQLSDWMFS